MRRSSRRPSFFSGRGDDPAWRRSFAAGQWCAASISLMNWTAYLSLMQKYADVPMSLADACLVRMTETLGDPLILTTDADFRIHRRHGCHIIPCVTPS